MKFFNNVETLEDLKKEYRKLIFKLHPDRGGNEEDFKAMKNEYDELFVRLQKGENASHFERKEDINQFKDIIESLIHFDGILIDVVGSWIWLGGETKPYKDDIKALGFMWSSKHKKWFFNGDNKKRRIINKKTYEEIKNEYGCKTYKSSGAMKIS